MANLELLADEFRKEGYSDQNAEQVFVIDIISIWCSSTQSPRRLTCDILNCIIRRC